MSDERIIQYGDRKMQLEPGMTLDQAKEIMARHFPELADPKVETKKTDGKTTYVFSKKAGHKGARRARPMAKVIKRLLAARKDVVVDPRLIEYVTREQGDAFVTRNLATVHQAEAQRVIDIRRVLADLPNASTPTGSVL